MGKKCIFCSHYAPALKKKGSQIGDNRIVFLAKSDYL